MKIQFILLLVFATFSLKLRSQTVIVMAGGVSLAYTDNPATSGKGKMINGYNVGFTGRFGNKNWFFRPGIELHNIQLLPEEKLDPFSNQSSMYILKFPAQIGLKVLKADHFTMRVEAGVQFSYVVSIQKNDLNLNTSTITDYQLGSIMGTGVDLGFMTIDVNFEKGLSEFYKHTGYTSDYFFITAGFLF